MKRPHYLRLSRRMALIGAIASLSVLVAATWAQAEIAQKPTKPPTDEAVIVRDGQTVSIDPATGRLREPTSDDARALAQQMFGTARSTPLTVQQNSNGMMWVILPEEYQDVAVLRVMPDGTRRIECVHAPEVSQLTIKAPAKVTASTHTSVTKTPARLHRAPLSATPGKSVRRSVKVASLTTVGR